MSKLPTRMLADLMSVVGTTSLIAENMVTEAPMNMNVASPTDNPKINSSRFLKLCSIAFAENKPV